MAALLIKNLPPTLHEQLRKRAATHHRSMNREVIAILERELSVPAVKEWPAPLKPRKRIDHAWVVKVIRDARDGKR